MSKKQKNKRIFIFMTSILLLFVIAFSSPMTTVIASAKETSSEENGTVIASRFGELLFGKKRESEERLKLCPAGEVFGVKISGAGLTVVRVLNDGASNLMRDDKIEKIDGKNVYSIEDVKNTLKNKSDSVRLGIIRDGVKCEISVKLNDGESDGSRLGVLLSDSAAGIGTITYINPMDSSFGGLGHGICDSERGGLLPMTSGISTGVILGGTSKGEAGNPGELRGILTHDTLGTIEKNTSCGVFGSFNKLGMEKKCRCAAIEIGYREEVVPGEAEIISTVRGAGRRTYKIEISDIDYSSSGSKSFKIKVTDPTLIAITGGIVRGMSGSPIIQNGRIIGAVTHVMISDPEEGYGIFIENMLAASAPAPEAKGAA